MNAAALYRSVVTRLAPRYRLHLDVSRRQQLCPVFSRSQTSERPSPWGESFPKDQAATEFSPDSKPLLHSAQIHSEQRRGMSLWGIVIIWCVLMVMAFGIRSANGQTAEDPTSVISEASGVQPEPTPQLTSEQIREMRSKAVERRISATRDYSDAMQRGAPDWLTSSQQMEINQLKFIELMYTQQEVLVEEQAELTAQLNTVYDDPAEWILNEIDESPPFSFLLLEKLRDDKADAQARADVFSVEIETARDLQQNAKQNNQDRQRERRKVRESLRLSRDSMERLALERKLINADLGCEISGGLIALRSLEVDVKGLESQVQQLRIQALTGAVDVVANNAPFSEQDLQTKLQQIDDQESAIQSQLGELQDRLTQSTGISDTTSLGDGSHGVMQAGGAAPSSLAKIDDTRDLIRQSLSQLNESLADLVILRHTWKARYDYINGKTDKAEHAKLFEQIGNFKSHVENSQLGLELRLKETRMRLTHLESSGESTAAGPTAAMLRELLAVTESRAVLLHQVERLVTRFEEELSESLATASFKEGLDNVFATVKEWWSYEVIAVDDRPITLGKIAIAVMMLVGGLILSRRLSRMLGSRMLPRLGIHEGASMAVQTVAFYLMVMICGFLTLDMLNIPLTVFTFLGGAAAIAVGFGSQNILNNFISGLIILGEQPIRVGDLVEIDGLHANIEHIGPRSTRVRTGSNLEIIVPNSRFLENNVTNWTLSNNDIRVCVKVGVAYGSPVNEVLKLLKQAVADEPRALDSPEPIILFNEFGDNSLNFEVHFWVRMRTIMDGRRVESTVRERIDGLFRTANITIAFPQRDVHLDISKPIEIALPGENRDLSPSYPRAA